MRELQVKLFGIKELKEETRDMVIEKLRASEEYSWYVSDLLAGHMKEKQDDLELSSMNLHYSLNHCQGDGCSVTGPVPAVIINRNIDKLDLTTPAKEYLKETYEVEIVSNTNHYVHSNTMSVKDSLAYDYTEDHEELKSEVLDSLDELILEDLKDCCGELEEFGYNVLDDYCTDESIIEYLDFNDCEFTENGTLWED